MNSTAPIGDRSQPEREPRRPSPAAIAPTPHCAICTPVPPPLIRIPFPAISFDCGGARYRTHPLELLAEPLPEGGVGSGEDRGRRIEDGTGKSAAPSGPSERSAPSSTLHPPSSPFASALPIPQGGCPLGPLRNPHSLRKELGVWRLIFDGREALLRHERGLLYVAWLLHHPPAQPIHALDLAARIPELYRAQLGLAALADPATGHATPLPSHARLQERSLALDDAHSLRALHRKEQELEAILDDDSESEPVKAEALRDLEAIAAFLRQHARRSRDAAHRAVHTVREAVRRFHVHLTRALDAQGLPHPVLRPFADHLQQHLLIPSTRYAGRGSRYARSDRAGCFTYEPPPGVVWSS